MGIVWIIKRTVGGKKGIIRRFEQVLECLEFSDDIFLLNRSVPTRLKILKINTPKPKMTEINLEHPRKKKSFRAWKTMVFYVSVFKVMMRQSKRQLTIRRFYLPV